jgi:tetratricopeptide (TPR) repeat protein
MSAASLELVLLLFVSTRLVGAQTPGPPPASEQEKLTETERLIRQVDELRRAGKFDEAVSAVERAVELERLSTGPMHTRVAEALARLAELQELRGDWDQAKVRLREVLVIREQVDGQSHWRTDDARQTLAFATQAASLGAVDRAKVKGALLKEQEAARLEAKGEYSEAEHVGLEALETYRAAIGTEIAAVARMWHFIGRVRLERKDTRGAGEATRRAWRAAARFYTRTTPTSPTAATTWGSCSWS